MKIHNTFTAAFFALLMMITIGPLARAQANESSELKVVNNPIIERMGVCDPHIHIFNDKAYLFASHDRKPGEKFYGMYDWWVWSSPDLVHWTMEFNLFPADMWVGAGNNCWAVDGAERNGKYYFYVSGNWKTGVAVSTNGPSGPYHDALKGSIPGVSYDPTVYIDDDENKTPYLITGSFPYKIARLNEDMMTLADEPKELIHDSVAWKGDGGFLHKHNGIYYLNGHGSKYSTSTNIYGPYTYRGTFYKHWIDHPMVFQWHNQTFCAFGTRGVDRTFRKTHITYLHYRDNGEMVACGEAGDSFIGVGQYDCSKPIEAEWYFATSDGTEKKEVETGFAVGALTNNAYLYYPRILNLAKNAEISLRVSSPNSGSFFEVREDAEDGRLLGTIEVPDTGGEFQTVSAKLSSKEGLTNVYLVYKGPEGGTATLDWFTLTSTGEILRPPEPDPIIVQAGLTPETLTFSAFSQIEAEDVVAYYLCRTSDAKDNNQSGRALSNLQNTSYASYQIDFGTEANPSLTFQARVASNNPHPGKIEIRLDGPDGELLGTCEFESTGGRQRWVTVEGKVNAPAGVQHVYLVFRGHEPEKHQNSYEIIRLNWFRFVK